MKGQTAFLPVWCSGQVDGIHMCTCTCVYMCVHTHTCVHAHFCKTVTLMCVPLPLHSPMVLATHSPMTDAPPCGSWLYLPPHSAHRTRWLSNQLHPAAWQEWWMERDGRRQEQSHLSRAPGESWPLTVVMDGNSALPSVGLAGCLAQPCTPGLGIP